MGGRYIITGVQLGILVQGNREDRIKIMQEIIDNQFIENTEQEVKQNVKEIRLKK